MIGAGRIGKVHAMAVEKVPGARISHVVDPFPDGARRWRPSTGPGGDAG
ncbi:MAG: hypothetical protein R3E89_16055 [Thiolinea sp.]